MTTRISPRINGCVLTSRETLFCFSALLMIQSFMDLGHILYIPWMYVSISEIFILGLMFKCCYVQYGRGTSPTRNTLLTNEWPNHPRCLNYLGSSSLRIMTRSFFSSHIPFFSRTLASTPSYTYLSLNS